MIADAEELIGRYLREHADVVALEARVSVKPPKTFSRPWVIVAQIAAGDRSRAPDHLMAHLMQMTCYASPTGGSVEAMLLGRVVRQALRDLTTLDEWVPSVIDLGGPRNFGPDEDFEPARDRTIVTADILLHPIMVAS